MAFLWCLNWSFWPLQMAVPVFAFSAKSQLAATMRSPAKSIKFRLRSVGTFLQRRSQCQGHSICKDKQKNWKLKRPSEKVATDVFVVDFYLQILTLLRQKIKTTKDFDCKIERNPLGCNRKKYRDSSRCLKIKCFHFFIKYFCDLWKLSLKDIVNVLFHTVRKSQNMSKYSIFRKIQNCEIEFLS